MALTQAQKDAKRKTTFVRINIVLLNLIREFSRRDNKTIQEEMAHVLRKHFIARQVREMIQKGKSPR